MLLSRDSCRPVVVMKVFSDKHIVGVNFQKMGISHEDNSSLSLYTLKTLLANNGHTNSVINYLKMDVEGAEIRGLPQWIKGEKWIFQGTKDEFEIEADDTYGSNWKSVVPKLYTPQLHFGIGYPF